MGIYNVMDEFVLVIQYSITGGDSPNNPSSGRFLKNLGRFYQSCWELGDFFKILGDFINHVGKWGLLGKSWEK